MPGSASFIDTREKLIHALGTVAELEHELLLQYLFTALTMKRSTTEGLTPAQLERCREWKRRILAVAREEMAHLATVCNLLQAVGGAPHFGRPELPRKKNATHPFDSVLEPFGESALRRFIEIEQPHPQHPPTRDSAPGATPDELPFANVGELYRMIADGFRTLSDALGDKLFIGPSQAQDTDDWTANLRILEVKNLETALAAIDFIIREGEGIAAAEEPVAPANLQGSHFETFSTLLSELLQEQQQQAFEPARPVLSNPLTHHPSASDPGSYHLLERDTLTHGVARLFNSTYTTVMLMLTQYYDYGGETAAQRAGLQANIRRAMSGLLRPLGEVLTALPAGKDYPGQTAGPSFELYTRMQIPGHLPSRWTVLLERVAHEEALCLQLAGAEASLARLGFLTEHYKLLRENLERLPGEGA